jgi:glycosyltransferase involved in cell wall biosynthesis
LKITYFSYLYDIKGVSAGSANKAIGFIGGLNTIGHDAKIYWRSVQPEDIEGDSVRLRMRNVFKRIFSYFVHDLRRLVSNLRYFFEELKILAREKPDVLFLRSELYNFSANLAARLHGIPVVLEVDCPTAYEHRHMSGKDKFRLPFIPEWIERWNWRRSHAIIAISTILKDYLVREGVPDSKITVIPNGADPDKFKPGLKGKTLRKKYGYQDKVVIGWIGSLFGWEGLDKLLEMARNILEMRSDVAFLFVGGGKNKEVMESAFDSKDIGTRVILTGTVSYDDVPEYLDAMDIVIAPYPKLEFWYPSSMKVFEYMSSQKAVVASAVGQLCEIIEDGVNGFLFDPDDMEAFTQKVIRLVDNSDLRRRIAINARDTVLEKYTWVKHAEEMEKIFQRISD